MTRRAVVLAGGHSRRFGDRDKALAPVGGEPMLRRVCRAARDATGSPPVVAVATAERAATYDDILDDATFVIDAPEPAGPAGGVRAALEGSTAPWLFLCGCDMPWLDASAIDWLFDRRAAADVVVPRAGEWCQPLHSWYRRGALEQALDAGVERLQALAGAVSDTETVAVDEAPDRIRLTESVRNVNTPDALDAE